MRFKRKGLIYKYGGELSWAKSHTYLPTPYLMTDRVRVYVSLWDSVKCGRIGYVDLSRVDLADIIKVSPRPILDVGEVGGFDMNGVSPSHVYLEDGGLTMLYIGWQLTKSPPYMLFGGKARLVGDKLISREIFLDRNPTEKFSRSAPFKCGNYIYYWNLDKWHYFDKYERYWYSSSIKCWDEKYKYSYTCLAPTKEEFCLGRPWVIKKGSNWHMWYSYKSWEDPKTYHIGYAYSMNGVSWIRRNFELTGRKEKWEGEGVCHASVLDLEDKMIMFYMGSSFGETGFGYAEGKW